MIFLWDANATVTETWYHGIGDVVSSKANAAANAFVSFLRECRLCLPTTFSAFSPLHLGTHYGSDGSTLARIDHIGVGASSSGTDEEHGG